MVVHIYKNHHWKQILLGIQLLQVVVAADTF